MRAGNADRSRHGDVERRVLVAVADLGPEHFERGRQAHGRLLVEQRVHVARQLLGARARAVDARDRLLGFRADLRRVALDERLRAEVPVDVRIGGTRPQALRVGQLDRRSDHGLAGALQIGARQIGAIELEAKQPHVARLVDALPHGGHDGRRLEQVGLHAARHRERLRAIRRLAHRHESQRALLAHHVARVGDPRRRVQSLVFHLDTERRDRALAGVAHDLAIADLHGDRGVAQRGGIEDRPLLARAGREVAAREQP